MTTLNDLRQQMEDLYLEPLMEETPSTTITTDINSTVATFVITAGVFSPDEESYLVAGRPLELDLEVVRITDYDASTHTVTCKRGVRGSTAVAHTAVDCEVRIPTRWPRHRMIAGLRASINGLWQPLFATKIELTTVETAPWVQLPLNTVRVLEVKLEPTRRRSVSYLGAQARWKSIPHELLPTHPLDPSVACVQLPQLPNPSALVRIAYGVQIAAPAGIDDEIVDLPPEYERIVVVDTAANLLAGVDIDAQTQEVLTQQIPLQNFPVGSASSISQSLIRYREYLVDQVQRELKARYPRRISHRTPSIY